MTDAERYYTTMNGLHAEPTTGFNDEYRAGLLQAHSKVHNKWCEDNPDATRYERKQAYRESYDRMRKDYPSVKELREKESKNVSTAERTT